MLFAGIPEQAEHGLHPDPRPPPRPQLPFDYLEIVAQLGATDPNQLKVAFGGQQVIFRLLVTVAEAFVASSSFSIVSSFL